MSDLIERQAAIDAFAKWCVAHLLPNNTKVWKMAISEMLKDVPSEQPEDQWIIDALKEHLGESYKPITENEKEFKDWLERMRWHVLECDKLARELEQAKASTQQNACEYWDGESGFCTLNRPSAQREITEEEVAEYVSKNGFVVVPGEYLEQLEIEKKIEATEQPRKKGKWIYTKKRLVRGGYVDASECSICHKRIMPHLKPNYCPNCGAEMVKGEEDE